jgi:hypothetical protein
MDQLQNIKCDNCNYIFDLGSYSPIIIPCGHTICRKCITSIWNRLAYIKCPFDNSKHFLDFNSYPINFMLKEWINKHSEYEKLKSK